MRNTYTPGAYLLLTGSLTGSAPVASTVATVSGTGTAASAAGLRGNGDGRSRIYWLPAPGLMLTTTAVLPVGPLA